MSTTEDRARAAMRAIAATVHDAPPLQFNPAPEPARAADEIESAGNGPHRPGAARPGKSRPGGHGRGLCSPRPGGTAGPPSRGGDRRWRSRLAPLTAAAVVVALAVALVTVKNLPNGSAVPGNPAQPAAAGPGGAPRYFIALKEAGRTSAPAGEDRVQFGIVVGDSLTGKTLATFKPPADTTFQSVSAAAGDRTFVVFAVTSSDGSFLPMKGATLTGSWYEVRLAPGTANPASLSRLPVKPVSWTATADAYTKAPPGQVYATALSASGQELAVADIPDIPAARAKPQDWQEVKVFSVATGRLLHDWIGNDPKARLMAVMGDTFAGVPVGTPDLTWIDGDKAIALATSLDESNKVTGTVRRLNVAGPASGNLMADSTVIWSGTLPGGQSDVCLDVNDWPPLISADGKTISCVTIDMPQATPGHVDFVTAPLTAGTATGIKPRLDYRAAIPPENQTGGINTGILWASPSAGTLIMEMVPGGNLSPPKSAYFGVVSHGKYTPLPIPKSLAASTAGDITF